MFLPFWALLGLGAAITTAAIMLLQEKHKIEGLSLAIWCKVACIVVTLPFVVIYGLPDNPYFYLFLFCQALMFAIADVILFRAIPVIGAGVISRLMPLSIILSFLLWFAIDPSLLLAYLEKPLIFCGILLTFFLTVYFGTQLKKCSISIQALKVIWFVIFANTAGAILAKIIMAQSTNPLQGALAFTFVEAWMMIAMWLLYIHRAKPIPFSALFEKKTALNGLIIGGIMAVNVVMLVASLHYVDNPGYVSALRFLDTVIIIFIHKMIGRQDNSNKMAGLGIAASAILLIILRELALS